MLACWPPRGQLLLVICTPAHAHCVRISLISVCQWRLLDRWHIWMYSYFFNFRSDGLAVVGNAPKIFMKTSRNGLPYVAIATCSFFGLLSFMGIKSGSGQVFTWFANMTAIAGTLTVRLLSINMLIPRIGLITWFGISVTYIRFYKGFKAQGFDRSNLPYASALQPYAAWYAAIACFVICLVSASCPLKPDANQLIDYVACSLADGRSS